MRILIDVDPRELDWGKSYAKRESQSAEVHGHTEVWETCEFDLDDISFDGREATIWDDDIDDALNYLMGEA